MKKFNKGKWLLLLLALVLVQVSCHNSNKEKVEKISYAIPQTIAAMPAYVASANNFWKDEGLEVDTKIFSSGRLALDALLSNSVEVMSTSETPLVHSILKGNKIFIISTITRHQEVKLIAHSDHGIKKPSDLKGKIIATLPGTNSDFYMYEFLRANNINVKDVKIINMPPAEMVTAFVSGDIDAYFAWEPYIYNSEEKLPHGTIIFKPGNLYHGRHCVAMNQLFVKENPEIVEKFLRGLLKAEKFIHDNPDKSIDITSKISGIPVKTLKTLLLEYQTHVELDSGLISILNREGQWAQSLNKTDSVNRTSPDLKTYIYYKALSDIKNSPLK